MDTIFFTVETSDATGAYDLEASSQLSVRELMQTTARLFDLHIEPRKDMEGWQMGMVSPRSPDHTQTMTLDQTLAEAGVRYGYWLILEQKPAIPAEIQQEAEESAETKASDDAASSAPAALITGWRPFDDLDYIDDQNSDEDSDEEQEFVWKRLN